MSEHINLKVSPEDKAILKNEAKSKGLSLSAYVRIKLLNSKPIKYEI
mgnify:CR=1 FL=1